MFRENAIYPEGYDVNLAKAYPHILSAYYRIATELAQEGMAILKTDLFNETESLPIPGGIIKHIPGAVIAIEKDQGRVNRAREMGITAYCADIRAIPIDDSRFDLILDFSTIDHVSEYMDVLAEYSRVLRAGGKLAIVYWAKRENDNDGDGQYYFSEAEIDTALRLLFDEERAEVLYSDTLKRLKLFIGNKPKQ
jgi:SAM-dependent methyltransferase